MSSIGQQKTNEHEYSGQEGDRVQEKQGPSEKCVCVFCVFIVFLTPTQAAHLLHIVAAQKRRCSGVVSAALFTAAWTLPPTQARYGNDQRQMRRASCEGTHSVGAQSSVLVESCRKPSLEAKP